MVLCDVMEHAPVRREFRDNLLPEREEVYENLERQVGNTPLYQIKFIEVPSGNRIFAKEEQGNPTGSNFDRVYPHLFRVAERAGYIIPGVTPVIESTTGNAGASFAWAARELGYTDTTVIVHADAPRARVEQIESYGAKVLLAPEGQYGKGNIELLERVLEQDRREKGGHLGENPERLYAVTKIVSEARVPYHRMADEAYEQLRDRQGAEAHYDYFVSVVGSGTYISGMGERLKEINPDIKIIAVEPAESPTVSALMRGEVLEQSEMQHTLFGATPFGLPADKFNINFGIIDGIQQVTTAEWQAMQKLLEKREGKRVGRSSGAELAIAVRLAAQTESANILIAFHDSAWKYSDSYEPDKFKV